MRLNSGTRLGPYEITVQVGAGGMGEVYRAVDTNLKRSIALKVLPEAVAADEDRLARLRREAQLLASLSHPNIAIVHGLEQSNGTTALVMELIEGPTLADRLDRGPLQAWEALPIARQIADALDAAHERGIVHRDLKPANIKIRPDGVVKVLDFGLAKALDPSNRPFGGSQTPTERVLTEARTILGTASYMSPEQARGGEVDKRADIWAFGCVLFELFTGRRAFDGRDSVEVLGRVLERTPDWSALSGTPPHVERLIRRCLEKDPRRRLRDIGDARSELDNETATTSPTPRMPGLALTATIVLLIAGAMGAGWWLGNIGSAAGPAPVSRLLIDVRPAEALLGASVLERTAFGRYRPSRTAIALAPNGRTIVFTAQRDGRQALYARSFDENMAEELPGTEGADGPFFSPDGQWVGFWAAGGLSRVSLAGGPPVRIADIAQPAGASWSEDGRIVMSGPGRTIVSVRATGGETTDLTKQSTDAPVFAHAHPQILPGGKWLLYSILPVANGWDTAYVVARSLATGEQHTLLEGAADARYVKTGHLVYMRLGNLMAARFDLANAVIVGEEVGVTEGVMQSVNTGAIPLDTGSGQYDVATNGTLAFVAGGPASDFVGTLTWIHRDGTREPISAPPRPYFAPRLSPDEQSIAVGTFSLYGQDLWRYGLAEGTLTRLTFSGRVEHPVWHPAGDLVAVGFSEAGAYSVYSVPTDGSAAPTRLSAALGNQFPGGWTPDGQSLVFYEAGDISVVSLQPQPATRPLVKTPFNERMPDLSPDGRWLAYVSDETGQPEVYVQSFPRLGSKRRISTAGGEEPAWSRDGRKLVYVVQSAETDRDQLLEVDVTLGDTFTAGAPRVLFEFEYTGAIGARAYDLRRDASRFLFVNEVYPPAEDVLDEIHIVENWFTELERLAPAR